MPDPITARVEPATPPPPTPRPEMYAVVIPPNTEYSIQFNIWRGTSLSQTPWHLEGFPPGSRLVVVPAEGAETGVAGLHETLEDELLPLCHDGIAGPYIYAAEVEAAVLRVLARLHIATSEGAE